MALFRAARLGCSAAGEPALVVHPLLAVNAVDLWVKELYTYGDPGLEQARMPAPVPESLQRVNLLLRHPVQQPAPTAALL